MMSNDGLCPSRLCEYLPLAEGKGSKYLFKFKVYIATYGLTR